MRYLRNVGDWCVVICLLTLLFVVPRVIDHQVRVYAQDHEWAYDLLTGSDANAFFHGGSMLLSNQVAWTYWQRLSQPRPLWHRVLFWGPNNKEPTVIRDYRYRPHFEHVFPPQLGG